MTWVLVVVFSLPSGLLQYLQLANHDLQYDMQYDNKNGKIEIPNSPVTSSQPSEHETIYMLTVEDQLTRVKIVIG